MADDQTTKTMDINDLVRELSKSSTSPMAPTSPLAPASQAPRPSFPPTPTPPPAVSYRPQFSVPPTPMSQPSQAKPVAPSLSTTHPVSPLPTPGVKEYQSTIRTMNDDMSRLKQGQQLAGVPLPRKVEQVIPVVPAPISPLAGQAKPAMPSPQFKVPSLGEAQKSAPLTQSKDFSRPIPPTPPPAPMKPKIEPKPQIYVPQEGQTMGNRNMLFIGIGAVAIVAGFAYWFFVLRSPTPEIVQETPTPTLTPTATPVQDLSTIFSNLTIQGVGVKSIDPIADLLNAISSTATEPINVNGGEFVKLNITSDTKGQISLGLLDFLLKPKQELIDSFGQDRMVLLYGQKEIFDSKGAIKLSAPVEKRLVFVLEVKDSYSATQTLLAWETTMVEDLQKLLSLNVSKQKNPQFLDNTYSGSTIRYRNFLWPDKSIDYSIVAVTNGKSYLVLAGSKESMFATIDKLKSF